MRIQQKVDLTYCQYDADLNEKHDFFKVSSYVPKLDQEGSLQMKTWV